MNSAGAGDAYKGAARAYVKALFKKIRALEPEMQDTLGKKEAAYLRRVESGKPLAD